MSQKQLYENIKKLRKIRGMSQEELGSKTGYKRSSICRIEAGNINISVAKVKLFANALGVPSSALLNASSTNELLHYVVKETLPEIQTVSIPVLSSISEEEPLHSLENVAEYMIVPESLVQDGTCFGLQIQDDSMAPDIRQGDVVIFTEQSNAQSGDYIIVLIDGGEAVCRKLILNEYGLILQPVNSSFAPVQYSERDIERLPVKILGIVRESRRSWPPLSAADAE